MTVEREPHEGLETVIAAGQAGEADGTAAVMALLQSAVVIALPTEPTPGENTFTPVLVPRDGTQFAAAFTAPDRIPQQVKDIAPFVAHLSGLQLVHVLDPAHGLVINPASRLGFELTPQILEQIRRDVTPAGAAADGPTAS